MSNAFDKSITHAPTNLPLSTSDRILSNKRVTACSVDIPLRNLN